MTQAEFQSKMMKARTFQELGDQAEYWAAYQRGLQRAFHGDKFGSDEDHEKWLSLISDETRQEQTRGYWHGLNGE